MEYDILIIGARVAGASLALLLGQRGYRILLVDRDRFPANPLSTNLILPQGVVLLERLGVLADVEAVGFRRITRARAYIEDCHFEGPLGPAGTFALAPRRNVLDPILIEHATKRGGVDFWEQTRVEGLIQEEHRVVGATLETSNGERRKIHTKVVVGADGKYSQVAEWVKAPRYYDLPAMRPVFFGYYQGVAPLPEPAMELFFTGNRIGFLFPMQPNVDCLALEIQADDFAAFRTNPKTMFEECFRALPTMSGRLQGAVLEGKIRGTPGLANFFRKPYGPGWVLTGDAGHGKDPSTGFGIRDALIQSFLLADALDAALSGADWEASLSDFERKRNKIMLPSYQSTIAYTQLDKMPPRDLAWLHGVLANPHFCRSLMQWLAGALPQVLPAHLQPEMQRMVKIFDTKNAGDAKARGETQE